MEKAFLLLGSNIGDRLGHLNKAIALLNERVGEVGEISQIYTTAPWGVEGQEDYYNQAIEVVTDLSPRDLLTTIKEIEVQVGRIPAERWAARIIDIDILLYGQSVVSEPDLIIPHERLHERNFALIPLMEIAGEQQHSRFQETITELYAKCRDEGEVLVLLD